MKILFILEYYYPHLGGVETLFKGLCERLVLEGYEVTVLTNQFDSALPKKEKLNGVSIQRLPFKNRYFFTFLAGFKAMSLAKNADLIHTTSYNAALPAYLSGKLSDTKMVITFHELWGDLWWRLPWMSRVSRYLYWSFESFIAGMNFNKFIAVSDFTKDALLENGIASDKVVRIYNGIDYSSIEEKHDPEHYNDPFTFLFFGRAGVSKGIDVLIDAVEILKGEHISFKVILVLSDRSNPLAKKVLDLINSKNLEGMFDMKYSLTYRLLQKQIATADAVIIPSYSEGFCFAAAETIAIGTPIISSGQGALKEVVGGNQLVFNDMSAVSLAKSLKKAIKGDWDHRPIRRFEMQTSVGEYIQVYKDLLQ